MHARLPGKYASAKCPVIVIQFLMAREWPHVQASGERITTDRLKDEEYNCRWRKPLIRFDHMLEWLEASDGSKLLAS